MCCQRVRQVGIRAFQRCGPGHLLKQKPDQRSRNAICRVRDCDRLAQVADELAVVKAVDRLHAVAVLHDIPPVRVQQPVHVLGTVFSPVRAQRRGRRLPDPVRRHPVPRAPGQRREQVVGRVRQGPAVPLPLRAFRQFLGEGGADRGRYGRRPVLRTGSGEPPDQGVGGHPREEEATVVGGCPCRDEPRSGRTVLLQNSARQ